MREFTSYLADTTSSESFEYIDLVAIIGAYLLEFMPLIAEKPVALKLRLNV